MTILPCRNYNMIWDYIFESREGVLVERHHLGRTVLALVLLEEEIVVAGGVEGRVEVDEVRDPVGHLAQDFEVVAVAQLVHEAVGYGELLPVEHTGSEASDAH